MSIKVPKAFIFDLDGTIYLGDEIIAGAKESLDWVRGCGAKIRFVTNNPRFSKEFYYNKLTQLGVQASLDEIVTSANITARYLQTHKDKFGRIYPIGEDQLLKELTDAGLSITAEKPDTVLVSFDTTLTYEKIMIAYKALKKGAHFLATHPDFVCPTEDGGLVDAGAIIAALEVSTNRKLEGVLGKPSPLLGEVLLEQLEVNPADCAVVGDRLNTDMKLAKQSKMKGIWINRENEEISDPFKNRPDFIIPSIAQLPSLFTSVNKNS